MVIKYNVQGLSMYKIDSVFKIIENLKSIRFETNRPTFTYIDITLARVQIELQMVIFSTSYYLRELS